MMATMVKVRRVREAIAAARASQGLSRRALAARSGVEETTIYRIESVRKLPKYEPDYRSIEAILTALGVPLSEFFARLEREDYSGAGEIPTKRGDTTTNDVRSSPRMGGDAIGPDTPLPAVSPEQRAFAGRLVYTYIRAAAAARRIESITLFENLALGVAMATSPELVTDARAAIEENRSRIAARYRNGRKSG